jgi:hypothetical protein
MSRATGKAKGELPRAEAHNHGMPQHGGNEEIQMIHPASVGDWVQGSLIAGCLEVLP